MQKDGWMRLVKVPAFCILHFALLMSLAACGTRARAATVPDGPPLAVPVPPRHEVAIEQVAEAPPPEPPPAAEETPPAPKPAPAVTNKPAPPRETPAPPPQPVTQTPPVEAPAVRATTSANDEKRARELLGRATDLLNNKVDYKRLSNDGRTQYDDAKRFADQAQQAIKERNFAYALTLADKAATLAAELLR
ncbi:MAG TPA: hypothetical protein VM846_05705 [Vicinamibacterales bacterium]|jgi:outer membrane biosynthesis protein TonB|nr:hypothetical protein [Vicinamibacterales bacterium]